MNQASVPHVRKEQYSLNSHLEIRDIGTEQWFKPPSYEGSQDMSPTNVVRATFTPGSISFFQPAAKPVYEKSRLVSALYMWKATFKFANLYDIRVKETEYGRTEKNDNVRQRIEILAVSKISPTGCELLTPAGTEISQVFNSARDTSDSTASGTELAKLSDRWVSGAQEIKLAFTRTTQIQRKHRLGTQFVSGPKVWVWYAFLAFLAGSEWTSRNTDQFANAAQMSLAQIVNSGRLNPHADFEKKDDNWILIKT